MKTGFHLSEGSKLHFKIWANLRQTLYWNSSNYSCEFWGLFVCLFIFILGKLRCVRVNPTVSMKFISRFFLTTYFSALWVSVGVCPSGYSKQSFPGSKNNAVPGRPCALMEVEVTTFPEHSKRHKALKCPISFHKLLVYLFPEAHVHLCWPLVERGVYQCHSGFPQ